MRDFFLDSDLEESPRRLSLSERRSSSNAEQAGRVGQQSRSRLATPSKGSQCDAFTATPCSNALPQGAGKQEENTRVQSQQIADSSLGLGYPPKVVQFPSNKLDEAAGKAVHDRGCQIHDGELQRSEEKQEAVEDSYPGTTAAAQQECETLQQKKPPPLLHSNGLDKMQATGRGADSRSRGAKTKATSRKTGRPKLKKNPTSPKEGRTGELVLTAVKGTSKSGAPPAKQSSPTKAEVIDLEEQQDNLDPPLRPALKRAASHKEVLKGNNALTAILQGAKDAKQGPKDSDSGTWRDIGKLLQQKGRRKRNERGAGVKAGASRDDSKVQKTELLQAGTGKPSDNGDRQQKEKSTTCSDSEGALCVEANGGSAQVLSSLEASSRAESGSEFQPSPASSQATPVRCRPRRKRKTEVNSDSSLSLEEASLSRRKHRGGSTDFFLTAAQKKRRKAAAEEMAARQLAKSAEQRRQEALQQLQADKRQRMEERAAFMGAQKANPFFRPRPTAADLPRAIPQLRALQVPAVALPPPLPPIHVTQVKTNHAWQDPRNPRRVRAVIQVEGVLDYPQHPHWSPAAEPKRAAPEALQEEIAIAGEQFRSIFLRRELKPICRLPPSTTVDEQLGCTNIQPSRVADPSENALWTDRFRPAKASEVCGNRGPVGELLEWLRVWRPGVETLEPSIRPEHDRVLGRESDAVERADSEEEWLRAGMGRHCYAEFSSDEDEPQRPAASQPCNAVWISGPTGCGKSAAIAAVAQELNLRIIEVNPGTDRSGANILRTVGEATQSSRLPASAEALVLDKVVPAMGSESGAGPPASSGTLVVFEEIDCLTEEDRGFTAALASLILESKRPIVLTSESGELPFGLHTLKLRHLQMEAPSTEEVSRCLRALLLAQGITLPELCLKVLLADRPNDIRHVLLRSQLWRSAAADLHLDLRFNLESMFAVAQSTSALGESGRKADKDHGGLISEIIADLDILSSTWSGEDLGEFELGDDLEWQPSERYDPVKSVPQGISEAAVEELQQAMDFNANEAPLQYRKTATRGSEPAAAAIAGVLAGASRTALCGSRMERIDKSWTVAKMAGLEADRKEAEDICPRAPRRGGRRRWFRHYLEIEVQMSSASTEAALRLNSLALCRHG